MSGSVILFGIIVVLMALAGLLLVMPFFLWLFNVRGIGLGGFDYSGPRAIYMVPRVVTRIDCPRRHRFATNRWLSAKSKFSARFWAWLMGRYVRAETVYDIDERLRDWWYGRGPIR